tara:strand:+ start:287 stop:571 length:285 start_codon:yes stop_codon:yes gene_type:complete
MIQKIVNVIAVSSGVVSLAVISSGLYVYVNRDAIIDGVKSQAMEAVLGGAGGLGGSLVPSLPTGSNDLMPSAPQSNPMAGENAAAGGSTIIPTF